MAHRPCSHGLQCGIRAVNELAVRCTSRAWLRKYPCVLRVCILLEFSCGYRAKRWTALPAALSKRNTCAMERIAKFAHRKISGLTGETDHSHRKLSLLAIQATAPEGETSTRLLKDIADGILAQKSSETDGVVKALSNRLSNSDTRIVLKSLHATDYLLRNVVEPRAANNLRTGIETILLPKIRRMAKGQPTSPGEPGPSQSVREAAMRQLQDWAAPRFINGALSKQTAFAVAYRDALANTPSPPTSAATEGTSGASNENVHLSPHTSLQKRPATPDSRSANGACTKRRDSNEYMGSPPSDDGQFVAYYSKVVETFDKLHQVQLFPLDDERIKNLRTIMEKNLDRLSRVQGTAHQKKAEKALKFAQQRLRKFSDYRPPPSITPAETASTSAAASSGAISMAAPPRYPPTTQAKRKPSGLYVPYGRETSDVYSCNPSTSQRLAEKDVVLTPEATIANASKSQRRMMCAISSACSISAPSDVWTRPPPVVLPDDLLSIESTPTAAAAVQPPPTQQFVHPGPPPSRQSFQMMYYAPQPHHSSQQMYQAPGQVPMQYGPPQPQQVHPQNSGGPMVTAYHQFSSYPRAV